jgi:hypothetical protein
MELLSMSYCKKRLAILWFISFVIIFLIILAQTVFGKYEDKFEEAWNWLTQNTLPTLSLIVSTFVVDIFENTQNDKKVDAFYYKFCLFGCSVYLFVLLLTILSQPIAHMYIKINHNENFESMTSIDFLKKSNLWLSPLQALISVLLGVFFIKKSN